MQTEPNAINDSNGEGATDESLLSMLVRPRFQSMEPRPNDFIVHDLIRPGTVTLFQGAPGSMKTWAALDLLRAAATGSRWLGAFPVDRVASLGIFLDSAPEDLFPQWRRLTQAQEEQFAEEALIAQTLEAEGIPHVEEEDPLAESDHPADEAYYSPFNDLVKFWWPPREMGTHLYSPDPEGGRIPKLNAELVKLLCYFLKETPHQLTRNVTPAPEAILQHAGGRSSWLSVQSLGTGSGMQLLVIDSLSKIHGLDENSNTEMEYVVNFFQQLARSTGIAVVLLHHWGKGSEGDGTVYSGRGASRIPDGADTLINFIKQPRADKKAPPKSKLVFVKVRGKQPEDLYIKLDESGNPDTDSDYLLEHHESIASAREHGVPLVLDPSEHEFARCTLEAVATGPDATEQLLLFIARAPLNQINVEMGTGWARAFLDLGTSEAAARKAGFYYKNRRAELSRLGLIAPTGKKGEYELTDKGRTAVEKLPERAHFREAMAQLASEDSGCARATVVVGEEDPS